MKTVMVVEDERDVVELLKFILEKDGYAVVTAYNGREAMEAIGLMPSDQKPVKPDLMILDIMMPEIDGYTLQNKMMTHETAHDIPIVILTAKGQMRDLFGMASNVAAYIDKPFDPQLLRSKVKEIFSKMS